MTVWIYIDESKQVGDVEHLHVSKDKAAADAWFQSPGKVYIYVDTYKDVGDRGYLV